MINIAAFCPVNSQLRAVVGENWVTRHHPPAKITTQMPILGELRSPPAKIAKSKGVNACTAKIPGKNRETKRCHRIDHTYDNDSH